MDDQQPDSTKKLAEGREFANPGSDRLTFDAAKLSANDIDVIILGNSCTDATATNSMVNKDIEYRLGCPDSPAPTSTTYQTFQHTYEIPQGVGMTVGDKGEDGRQPALPKLTIKRTTPPQLTSFFCDAAPEVPDGVGKEPDEVPLVESQPKLKLKITKDTQVATEYQPIPKLTIKTNYLEQGSSTTVIREEIPESLPKLKLKTTYKAEEMTPLEIVTPSQKIVLDAEEACQKSPRIILKINKNQTYCVSTTNCTETKQEVTPPCPSPPVSPAKAAPTPPLLEEQENGDMKEEFEEAEECILGDNQVNSTDMECMLIDEHESNGEILKADLPLSSTNEMSDISFSNSIADNCIIVPDESNSDCMIVKSSNSEDPLQLQNFNECFPTFEGLPSGENSVALPEPTEVPVKRRRGRPRKHPLPDSTGTPVPDSTTTTTPNHQRSPSPMRKVRRKRTKRAVATPKVQTPKTPPARQKFNKNKYFRQKMLQETLNNSIQLFEEDTRMSGEIPTTSSKKQSGTTKVVQSSSQKTMDSSSLGEDSSSKTITKKSRGRMEVNEEGGMEFTVEMLAEYDWPPPVGCCPNKNRDTYMLQEQIAELLGVKSFKRKYPYLYRRSVEMEERNYLIEKKLVSEKMSNLGLTAVYAVDILDIMYQDFNDKYEEYKKYHREKQLRDASSRQQKGVKVHEVDKATVHEKALKSTASWNTKLNKMRNENRMGCIDLQSFIVNIPRRKVTPPPTFSDPAASAYPVELIPGQYSTQWEFYTPASLIYYPLKTARPLDEEPHEWLLINKKEPAGSSSESSSDSGSESSSGASSESFSDSDDENAKDDFCSMCPTTGKNPPERKAMHSKDDHSATPCKRKGD